MYSKRSKLFLFLAVLMSLSLVLSACQPQAEEPVEEPAEEEVVVEEEEEAEAEEEEMEEEEAEEETMEEEVFKVGFLGPFSGPSAQTGKQFKGGATIALESMDYQIGHYTIEPVWIDSQSDPDRKSVV